MADWKIVNIKWKENTDLPTELDLPESCLDEEGHPDKELILYWLEDEIGYACDGFEVVTKASFQEFERTYGYRSHGKTRKNCWKKIGLEQQ